MSKGKGEKKTSTKRWQVPSDLAGARLDRQVAQGLGVSRKEARILIGSGQVMVSGRTLRFAGREIAEGRRIEILEEHDAKAPAKTTASKGASPRPQLQILEEDRYFVVVNKPAGLLSEKDRFGAPAVETVLPKMLTHRPRGLWLVHRLDAGTSGVMILAKTPMASAHFGECFRTGKVHKEYLALCQWPKEPTPLHGLLDQSGEGTSSVVYEIDAPLGRIRGTQQGVRKDGKPAQTKVMVLSQHGEGEGAAALVRALPKTGRTHQIRVHLAHIGHPLWGDGLYGGARYDFGTPPAAIGRPMLHAHRLQLTHPKDGTPLNFEVPPPADFLNLAQGLGVGSPLGAQAE